MIPIHFEGVTAIYKGNDLQPGDLPVLRTSDTATSRWQPTHAEIQRLSRGGSVELVIHGGQPAVALRVV